MTDSVSFYDEVGGDALFRHLVDLFYQGVEQDEGLRAMYPEADLAPARHRMATFLAQYWGGPKAYGDERGHPRLRLRHSSFPIDDDARVRWLTHMGEALAQVEISDAQRDRLWHYFERAALTLVNR